MLRKVNFVHRIWYIVYRLRFPVLSAILLILAYPRFNFWLLAWIALVPLFFALENKNAKQRFILGYIFGIVFFSGILYWLLNVTGPGTVVLIIYLAIFPALFCLLCPSPAMHHSLRSGAGHVVFVPAAWGFTE